jgi:hypothetical protein
MSVPSKIEVKVGAVSFTGEGDPTWLAEQLDKVLKAAPEVAATEMLPDTENEKVDQSQTSKNTQTATLASYIRQKGGSENQVDRFLATADWLRQRGKQLTTAAVTSALRDHHQKKLANPADCLNKNVSKGFCEKSGDGFFITPDGLQKLGHKNG